MQQLSLGFSNDPAYHLIYSLLSSSNTWLQKQCIRKYIMIIIISANKFLLTASGLWLT